MREEMMEKQRSRVNLLKEGDRNTEFFHAKAKERARQNKIISLKDESGTIFSKQEDLEHLASDFYSNLFKAQDQLDPELVLQHVAPKLTDDMNKDLIKPFTADEVDRALASMKPNKSPGIDGFTAGFFQKHWRSIGPGVTRPLLDFLNGGDLPECINQTILVLTPKVKNPQELKQFRPISLCNVIYKLCSKVIANRLRPLLNDIISEEQSAFVPGRLITDDVLIAYECTHYLKRKKGKQGAYAVKLDTEKAYDRVEWDYLKGMMVKLGFAESFVNLIMSCVTSISFSVRVNGHYSELFKPTRGIRQGDPISVPNLC